MISGATKQELEIANARAELLLEIKDKDKEIEKLNKRVKECEEAYLRTRQQYSELENKYVTDEYIINELEKYLNEQIQKSWEIEEQCYEDIESKLQELKGDSSNE